MNKKQELYCPICQYDKDYKCKRKYEGKFIVYTCPNCDQYWIFNRQIGD